MEPHARPGGAIEPLRQHLGPIRPISHITLHWLYTLSLVVAGVYAYAHGDALVIAAPDRTNSG